MITLRDKVKKVFPKIPEDIKELLSGTSLVDIVDEIADQFLIDESSANIVIEACTRLLIADIGPTEFIPLLQEDLDIDEERANTLAKELNQKIFAPVKTSLLVLHTKVAQPQTTPERNAPASSVATLAPGLSQRVAEKQSIAKPDAVTESTKSVFEQKLGKTFAAPSIVSDATGTIKPNDPYRESV